MSDADEIGELETQLNEMAAYLEQAVGQLSRLAEQNRLLAEEAGRGAALEERARIARDLHDTVNQQLFVLSLRAAAVRKRVGAASGAAAGGDGAGVEPQLVTELANLEELARTAHSQIRELILQLRPTTLEQHGLGPALAEYVKTVAERENWAVENEIDQALRLRGAEGEALFRVAQEALNNVAKHARASRIRVVLERADEGEIRLLVADDGVGFDRRAGIRPTAVGLAGMHGAHDRPRREHSGAQRPRGRHRGAGGPAAFAAEGRGRRSIGWRRRGQAAYPAQGAGRASKRRRVERSPHAQRGGVRRAPRR